MSTGSLTYEESDKPRMGRVRKSSAKNEVLLKPRLGKSKAVIRDLPGPDFSYGQLTEFSDGVREALVTDPVVVTQRGDKGSDYRAMNKLAPTMHIFRADQQRRYRKEHHIRLKVKKRMAHVPPIPSKVNPNHVYGVPLERSDDMNGVMRQAYTEDWIKMNLNHQHNYEVFTPRFLPVKTNKTTDMRISKSARSGEPETARERFIMSKFRSVKHKIENVQTTPLLRDKRPPVFHKRECHHLQEQQQQQQDKHKSCPSNQDNKSQDQVEDQGEEPTSK